MVKLESRTIKDDAHLIFTGANCCANMTNFKYSNLPSDLNGTADV